MLGGVKLITSARDKLRHCTVLLGPYQARGYGNFGVIVAPTDVPKLVNHFAELGKANLESFATHIYDFAWPMRV